MIMERLLYGSSRKRVSGKGRAAGAKEQKNMVGLMDVYHI